MFTQLFCVLTWLVSRFSTCTERRCSQERYRLTSLVAPSRERNGTECLAEATPAFIAALVWHLFVAPISANNRHRDFAIA